MDVRAFWENAKRILRLSRKPTTSEIWMQLKISMVSLFIVGFVAFIIQLMIQLLFALLAPG